jgi:uncharacterized protein
MVGRLLLLVLAFAALLWWLRRPSPVQPKSPGAASAEEMLACARCGLHIPRRESRLDSTGRAFCSELHAELGPAP